MEPILGADTQEKVGVIVLYRNKILLIKGVKGFWSFPKGRRREGETAYEGALREAREEAGIDLSPYKCSVSIKLYYGTYFFYNLMRQPTLAAPSTPEEVLEVGWKNFQSVKNEEKNADLRFYFSMKRRPKVKAQHVVV
jgi:8-oxo-dGTP pyrophosphatase MutT (NUDIX family)